MKVLYVSGYNENWAVTRGLLDKNARFLQKPFTADLLGRQSERTATSGAGPRGRETSYRYMSLLHSRSPFPPQRPGSLTYLGERPELTVAASVDRGPLEELLQKHEEVPQMRLRSFVLTGLLCIAIAMATCLQANGQAGFDDDRVMLQGFYWESHRHGHSRFPEFTGGKWYTIVLENAAKIREGRFDMIWLPPPSFAGEPSAGYNPKQYFNLSNSYGSFKQHRAMIEGLLKNGIEPIADIVINHRDGNSNWVDFKNPEWGLWAICRTDEAFCSPDSPLIPERRWSSEVPRRNVPRTCLIKGLPIGTMPSVTSTTRTSRCAATSLNTCSS